jgi:hypothetical protein
LAKRTVILHYHLFKNAGTSLDAILQRNFPGRWVTQEFARDYNSAEVADWIAANPQAVAFSSHTAQGPLPELPDTRIVSVLFLRDPVARIRSAYLFECTQRDDSTDPLGIELAAARDFEGYIRARLAIPGDRQCRDFHVARLSRFVPGPPDRELDRAMAALSCLTVVGRVESFAQSVARLALALRDAFPAFDPRPVHENRSEGRTDLIIGPALAELLEQNNAQDRALLAAAQAGIWAAQTPP